MPDSNIIFYGVNWCWDCRRARRFLDRKIIEYEWINIDKDKSGEEYVLKVNNGMRSVPTILFQDGSILVEPKNSELSQKLGI
jgi:mycoredoxin